jgi:hypothetical protein
MTASQKEIEALDALAPFDVDTLERDAAMICALDGVLQITYVNRAWSAFAPENGGSRSPIGMSLRDAIPPVLLSTHEDLCARARTARTPVERSFECSGPTVFREGHVRVFPCKGEVVLVAHALSRRAPENRVPSRSVEDLYRDGGGTLLQCSYCRRVRQAVGEVRHWDWIPAYSGQVVPKTSHGLCPLCERYYFPA